MKILMLVNWKVEYVTQQPENKQPPDYVMKGEPYWFFRYWPAPAEIDVVDIRSWKFLEKIEKGFLHFYVIQTLKVLHKMKRYDLVICHGMQSGAVLSLIRRVFSIHRPSFVVFDIGGFNSAAEKGIIMRVMQFASKSIDGVIYHTSAQKKYYERYYPWLTKKSQFIPFGTDASFFNLNRINKVAPNPFEHPYILCIGYSKRDWNTLLRAYSLVKTDVRLRLIGKEDLEITDKRIELFPFLSIQKLIHEITGALFCVLPLECFNYSYGQMTLLQQMILGKAVIAARVPSMVDYIIHGDTALFYKSKDTLDLVRKIDLLLSDSALRNRLGANAHREVLTRFNEPMMAERIYEYVHGIMNNRWA